MFNHDKEAARIRAELKKRRAGIHIIGAKIISNGADGIVLGYYDHASDMPAAMQGVSGD